MLIVTLWFIHKAKKARAVNLLSGTPVIHAMVGSPTHASTTLPKDELPVVAKTKMPKDPNHPFKTTEAREFPNMMHVGPLSPPSHLKASAEFIIKFAHKRSKKNRASRDCEDTDQVGALSRTAHVAVEYSIPHLELMTEFVYGGLGTVSGRWCGVVWG